MKFIFFGTPEFAAIILEKLIRAGFPPAAVICNPDRPAGKKKIITPPPTKILAEKYGIDILQPEILANYKLQITNYKSDFFIVAAYAKILPKEIINMPRLGTIGVHPSLLPKYRGATPIQSAILNGESETGATIFLIDAKVDHGPILANSKIQITNSKNYKNLEKELAELGGDLLVETIPKFVNSGVEPQPQNENEATYTKKFTGEDGFVDLQRDNPETIWRKIRALNPEPGVYTIKNGKRIKLLEAEFEKRELKITKIQVEGKKPTTSLIPLLS